MTHSRPYLLPLLALVLTTGCHKKNSAINPASLGPTSDLNGPAPTATITADPAAINQGQSTVLNWRTTNATSVTIDGIGQVNPNGTQNATPTTSTNFHLIAKGDGGTTEANVRVTVRVPESLPTTGGGTILSRDQNQPLGGSVTDQAFHAAVQDIFFDYDAIDLRPDARDAADSAAAFLKSHPTIRVLIGGYCDERGSAEYNLALGENRANAAKAALIGAGVSPTRIRIISYGKEKQFCTEAAESCYQENRRAQFSIDR